MRCSKFGPLVLCLLMVGGCSTSPLVKTEVIQRMPPEVLMQECPETVIPQSGNNGDLLEVAASLRQDLEECNKKLKRLREWAHEHQTPGSK